MRFCTIINPCLPAVFMLLPFAASAAAENNESRALVSATKALHTEPMSAGYLGQLVTGLVVVLLCIVVLAWAARKLNRYRFVADDSLKIIGGLSLGAREKIVLMQVGKEQLLIGVAPGRISTLHKLETPLETSRLKADESPEQSFSNKLKMAMAGFNKLAGMHPGSKQ